MPEWYLTLNTGAEKHSDGSSPQLVVLLLPTFLRPPFQKKSEYLNKLVGQW